MYYEKEHQRNARLTQRNRAIGIADMGPLNGRLQRTLNCSQAVISNLLSRYQQTGQAQDREDQRSQLQVKTATSGQSTCGTDS